MCARAKFLAQSSAVLNYLEMGTGAHIWVHVKGGQRALKIFTEKQDDVSEVLKKVQREASLEQVRADLLQLYRSAGEKDKGEVT